MQTVRGDCCKRDESCRDESCCKRTASAPNSSCNAVDAVDDLHRRAGMRHAAGSGEKRRQTTGERALSCSERLVQTRTLAADVVSTLSGVQHAAKVKGAAHEQQRDALGVS
jgi:hypothetical protein